MDAAADAVQTAEVRVFDVEEFVSDCRSALAEDRPHVAVKDVVERAIADPAAIDARLGEPSTGGLEPLYRSPELTVLWIVWPPGVRLFPHDHRMWAANGIYAGREDNTFYRRTPEGIVTSGGAQLDARGTLLLGADAIHAVTNPGSRYTAAIHVYGGDYFAAPRSQWDPETLQEAPFDVERVRSLLASADDEERRR